MIGIDAGGTMTDTILVDAEGRFKIGKAATTPRDEAERLIASAEDAAEAWGIDLPPLFGGVDVVLCSGTGMLNTLLSRTGRMGRKLGPIVTRGMEDMVPMGRGLQAWADSSYADRPGPSASAAAAWSPPSPTATRSWAGSTPTTSWAAR